MSTTKMKKIFILLLAIILTATTVGCGNDQTETTPDTSSADPVVQETEKEETVNQRLLISDNLPETKFDGKDFIVLTYTESQAKHWFTEEYTGEGVNDSVFNRNNTLAERFDASVQTYAADGYQKVGTQIKIASNSGDSDAFHLISSHVVSLGGHLKHLISWSDIDYVDFSQPWWSPSTTEELTYNNVCFIAVGDAALSSIGASYCVFYDKNLAEKKNIENLYEVIKEGRWTISPLLSNRLTKTQTVI